MENEKLEPATDPKLMATQLLSVAAHGARETLLSCSDAATILQLKAEQSPSEASISAVRQMLHGLVAEIECALDPHALDHETSGVAKTWKLMLQAGFLADPELLERVLAAHAESCLSRSLSNSYDFSIQQIAPAKLISSEDAEISHTAKLLLQSMAMNDGVSISYRQLSAPVLHRLCWRIVGSLQIIQGADDLALVDAAKSMLRQHDEAARTGYLSERLLFFASGKTDFAWSNPKLAGLHLFVAKLAQINKLDFDHVMLLANAHSVLPLAILAHQAGLTLQETMEAIFALRGFGLRPAQMSMIEQCLPLLSNEEVQAQIDIWRQDRITSLQFEEFSL